MNHKKTFPIFLFSILRVILETGNFIFREIFVKKNNALFFAITENTLFNVWIINLFTEISTYSYFHKKKRNVSFEKPFFSAIFQIHENQ
jgi:hypothetical protein